MGDDAIGLCLDGIISAEVALARLLLGGATAPEIASLVASRRPDPPTPRWTRLASLLDGRTESLGRLAAEIAAVGSDHTSFSQTGIAGIAAFFDRQAARAPEAGVALYSLGDPAILAAATAEIVDWLDREHLLHGTPDILDLGCGIGRLTAALAPRCRTILGLDVSPGMIAEARRRCLGIGNARFETTSGQGLDDVPEQALDLVLAVDSFPYILQAGDDVTQRHIEGAHQALRPGGALAILNLSYRQDSRRDREDAEGWAARHGFTLATAGEKPFTLWDGVAFVLRR